MACVFCEIVARKVAADIIYEDEKVLAFLDKYPQTRGQMQLVPKVHYRWIYELGDIGSFFTTAQKIIRGIIPVLEADHVTLATFGHQIAHAHLWIVPQYARAVSLQETHRHIEGESLTELGQQLKSALKSKIKNQNSK